MATTRKSTPTILAQINLEIADFDDKLYKTTYYVLRNMIGGELSRKAKKEGENFDWKTFKEQTFIEYFGSIEERKYSLKDLLAYAEQKFGLDRQGILDTNRRIYRQYQQRQSIGCGG